MVRTKPSGVPGAKCNDSVTPVSLIKMNKGYVIYFVFYNFSIRSQSTKEIKSVIFKFQE